METAIPTYTWREVLKQNSIHDEATAERAAQRLFTAMEEVEPGTFTLEFFLDRVAADPDYIIEEDME